MHAKFQPPRLPISGRFMVVEKNKKRQKNKKFHRINGFLSLQLELRLELGFRLRLTNNNLSMNDYGSLSLGRDTFKNVD